MFSGGQQSKQVMGRMQRLFQDAVCLLQAAGGEDVSCSFMTFSTVSVILCRVFLPAADTPGFPCVRTLSVKLHLNDTLII